jgi:hypothetical protein
MGKGSFIRNKSLSSLNNPMPEMYVVWSGQMVDYFNSKFKLINYLIINSLCFIFTKAMRGILNNL